MTVIVWGFDTVVLIYLWPTFAYSAYKRAIVRHGLGGGSITTTTTYLAGRHEEISSNGVSTTLTKYVAARSGWVLLMPRDAN